MFPEDFPYYESYNPTRVSTWPLTQPTSNRAELFANCPIFSGQVQVIARVKGGPLAPEILGIVLFRDVPGGTEVCADITGLPPYKPAKGSQAPIGPHGFHIHEVGNCEIGEPQDPFKAAGEHWNPVNQPHGNHAGDFPVLFSNSGRTRMCFFTDKFKPSDVIGKSVIIHQNPDDYRTQPAGNAGKRLACGVIERVTAARG
jgi:Cu-Zn family superoxide dismutase